jgi:signal transduction histidine kinase
MMAIVHAITSMSIQEKLQAELKVRDEFFSAVAHELRNPLNALHLTLAGLLRAQSGTTPLAPEQITTRLNRATTQVTRLAKLVDDMLDVSRISGGRLQLQIEEFDAVPIVKEVVERERDAAKPAPISLATPPALALRGDRTRFAQIVSNLLSNATAYGNQKPIEVRLASGDSTFRLEVVDHGIGIAEADQERIFERFAKLGKDTPNVRFGLGLWVAREVARAMRGDIRVSSSLGAGATFIVELPKAPSEPAPAPVRR